MNLNKNRRRIALVAGMVILAALGFNIATVQVHGHGGGGHGGGGHGGGGHGGGGHGGGRGGAGFGGGGHHHGEHAHAHYRGGAHQEEGADHDSHYHHDHDDYGDHRHDCRSISDTGKSDGKDRRDPFNEECRNHDGAWEPSAGD